MLNLKLLLISATLVFSTASNANQQASEQVSGHVKSYTQAQQEYIKYKNKHEKVLNNFAKTSYKNGAAYKTYIEKTAKNKNISPDIFALAALESGFNPKAKSTTQNAGMWQISKAIGKESGLKINNNIDERFEWKKSTHAALNHIKEKNNKFKNLDLAVLSYSIGNRKIEKAIAKHNTNNTWILLSDSQIFNKRDKDYMFKYMAFKEKFKQINL